MANNHMTVRLDNVFEGRKADVPVYGGIIYIDDIFHCYVLTEPCWPPQIENVTILRLDEDLGVLNQLESTEKEKVFNEIRRAF